MKKTVLKIVSLLLCLMIGLVAFACQPTPPDDGNLDEIDLNVDPQIEAELRIAVKNDKAEIDAMQKVMDAFQELYPNVTYDLVPITDYEATIMGDVASGLVYDVMWAADAYVTLFADEDLLLNSIPSSRSPGLTKRCTTIPSSGWGSISTADRSIFCRAITPRS